MLNLDYYKGKDLYSDGEIENEILEIVKKNDNFHDIIINDNRWPILYHLSPVRRNLLEWYPFDKEKTLLEVGAGCGALTGLFCEKTKHTTAIELSKRRAEINAARHGKYNNLEIIVGNLQDIQLDNKYDYITLIGVLEYAGMFTTGPTPYLSFLKDIKKNLNSGGHLIIAIENQFGIKYLAGAKEDHLAQSFVGLEGYKPESGCKTFGKIELSRLINDAGFSKLDYYYPIPDYKLPDTVFSDDHLPTSADICHISPNYDNERYIIFNERKVLTEIIHNNMFPFFSNSFLIDIKV